MVGITASESLEDRKIVVGDVTNECMPDAGEEFFIFACVAAFDDRQMLAETGG